MATILLLAIVILRPLAAQPLATIGESVISGRDLERRVAIERAYGGTLTREAAIVSLVNDAIECEVARSSGVLPQAAELQRFSDHVDRSSKAPGVLAAVKRIFGRDTAGYRRQYLQPKLVNMNLHRYVSYDTVLNSRPRRAIQEAYALAARGVRFDEAARRTNLHHRIDSLRAQARLPLRPEPPRYASPTVDGSDPYHQIVSSLAVGELFGTIVETDGDYRILRLISRSDSMQVVEVLSSGKGEFDEWFRGIAGKIPIGIEDPRLARRVARAYPGLWWLPQLAGRTPR